MSIVKSFSVGNGDMFCIVHNSDNFSIIDCCYADEAGMQKDFLEMLHYRNEKGIMRFISTHPDEDHIKGLSELEKYIYIDNFYCVKNKAIKNDENTKDFEKYCELRNRENTFFLKEGCYRHWMNRADGVRGSAGINILWPDVNNEYHKNALYNVEKGRDFNNISPIITYSVENGAKMMWMGDMEDSFRGKIEKAVNWPEIDVLFAPHHGRKSGRVSESILKMLKPQIIVVGEAPAEDLEYYSGYNTLTQNSTNDITFDCDNGWVHIYVENSSYEGSVSILCDRDKQNYELGKYIGSFKSHRE